MMNLQATELKAFRKTLALWHISDFKLADEICQSQNRIKNYNGIIDTDMDLLDKLSKGESGVLKTESELKEDVKDMLTRIESEKQSLSKKREECDKDLDKGYALVTDALMDAIKTYLVDIFSAKAESDLLNALVKWFSYNGAKDADIDSVRPYIRALGQKTNSSRGKAKTNKHNKVDTDKNIKKIFLGAICDEPKMANVLGTHKWVTIVEKKTK